MSQCRADPACPFPAREGYRYCGVHLTEAQLTMTLHEMSNGGQRQLELEGDLWRGFNVHMRGHTVADTLDDKRRTEEKKKATKMKYANSYCVADLPTGFRCNARIPADEFVCEDCRERLLPTPKHCKEE